MFGNIDNWKAAWGTLRSIVVSAFSDEDELDAPTLVSVWQDSNKVGFCNTAHNGTEWVVRNRKRPKETST